MCHNILYMLIKFVCFLFFEINKNDLVKVFVWYFALLISIKLCYFFLSWVVGYPNSLTFSHLEFRVLHVYALSLLYIYVYLHCVLYVQSVFCKFFLSLYFQKAQVSIDRRNNNSISKHLYYINLYNKCFHRLSSFGSK